MTILDCGCSHDIRDRWGCFLKIAIDARMIRPGSMHGIARYVFQLLKGLSSSGQGHTYYVLVNQDTPLLNLTWPDHVKLVSLKSHWISLSEQTEIPIFLRKIKAHLFHAPSFVAPMLVPCKMIMTIHDLNHMVLPQFYTLFHQFYYQIIVRASIQRSQYILTVSHFSKREIERTLGLDANKIFVTYNGVSSRYHPINDREYLSYVRDIYGLPEKFILCVSNNKPHKNVQQLVRAFCYSDIKIPLVLACPVDRGLIQVAENFGKKHLLYFSKFVEEKHLPAFYSMTELFVYPSTYEGFGLPPLEALSCGAPVVVARSSSLPEVVGSHAIFANPYDFKAIAEALERGIYDRSLREQLRRDGLGHAKKFSWEKMTSQTLEVYERCYKKIVPKSLGVKTL